MIWERLHLRARREPRPLPRPAGRVVFWDAPGRDDGLVRRRHCSTARTTSRSPAHIWVPAERACGARRGRVRSLAAEGCRPSPACAGPKWPGRPAEAGAPAQASGLAGRARRRSAAARRRRSRCARRARGRAARRRRRPRRDGRRPRRTAASASSCTDFGSRPSSPVGRTSPQAWMNPDSSSHAKSVFCSSVSRGIARCSACESTATISTSG